MKTIDMEIVDIRKINGAGGLKARADVKVGDSFILKGVAVMEGSRGLFVTMPRRAGKDGNWYDQVVPASEEVKREIENLVLEAYDRETDGVKG